MSRGSHLFVVVAAVPLILAAAACSKHNSNNGVKAPAQQDNVTVYDNRIDPTEFGLSSGTPAILTVHNQSKSTCAFFVGNYAPPTDIAAGKTSSIRFTIDQPSGSASNVNNVVTMGCNNDTARQGKVEVRFQGVTGTH